MNEQVPSKESVKQFITTMYGSRCVEFSAACSCCIAWNRFDRWLASTTHEPPADEQIDQTIRRIEECELSMDDSEGLVAMLTELKQRRAAQPPGAMPWDSPDGGSAVSADPMQLRVTVRFERPQEFDAMLALLGCSDPTKSGEQS